MDDFMARVHYWLSSVKAKDLPSVAKLTQVPTGTLINLKYGRTTRPTLPTVQKIQRYLDGNGL